MIHNNSNVKDVVGTYKIDPYNLAFPVSDRNYSTGPSPFKSSIIIDKQENRLLWGTVYFKPLQSSKWLKANFTGTLDYKGQIDLVIDSKTAPNSDHARYTLTPCPNKYYDYQVKFQVIGHGLSFISHSKKISTKAIVPRN